VNEKRKSITLNNIFNCQVKEAVLSSPPPPPPQQPMDPILKQLNPVKNSTALLTSILILSLNLSSSTN
jgi:hypothetical protein